MITSNIWHLTVISKTQVNLNGGRFPLFTVELKVTEGTTANPAKFTYSASAESLHNSVMSHYTNSFELLKGTVHVRAVNYSMLSLCTFFSFCISFSCISSYTIWVFLFTIYTEAFFLLIHLSISVSMIDIVKIERRIMKNLFWANSPIIQVRTYYWLYVRSYNDAHFLSPISLL